VSKLRAEHLLPLACAAACALLAASEFMDTFKLNGPGPSLQVVQSASDQHHYALLVLAGFALISLVIAVVAGSKPAATAVAVCGVGALLIFLLIDLPDAGKVGAISDVNLTEAKAVPTTGFWLELTGALVLAICGGALATLSSDQLRAFARTIEGGRPSSRYRGPRRRPANPGNEAREASAEEGDAEKEGSSGRTPQPGPPSPEERRGAKTEPG
jgi:hypothetical protein